jgi:UDP-N-acetylglucosamine 2-epimerase (non-hydrolysing)
MHRPSNVDKKEALVPIVRFLINEVCKEILLIWTIHSRTRRMLEIYGLLDEVIFQENLLLLEPLDYLEMLKLNMHARIILTDSGGLQEECTALGTPCLTLRWNTERPITLREHGGASVLVGNNIEIIRNEFFSSINKPRNPKHPELWDGRTAERCLKAILDFKR